MGRRRRGESLPQIFLQLCCASSADSLRRRHSDLPEVPLLDDQANREARAQCRWACSSFPKCRGTVIA